jgi:hypothetical protein
MFNNFFAVLLLLFFVCMAFFSKTVFFFLSLVVFCCVLCTLVLRLITEVFFQISIDLISVLPECIEYIHDAIVDKGKVFVHCMR